MKEITHPKEKLPVKKDESLFSLVQLSHKIQEALVEHMGELTPEIEQAIDKLHNNLPAKADGYHFFIEDLKSRAKVFNDRAVAFTRIADAMLSYTTRLKYSLKMACIELGVDELIGTDWKWKLVSNQPSLIVENEGMIPAKYKEVIQTFKIRSDLIKEDLKKGEIVPGARLESGSHVRPYVNNTLKK